MAPEDRLRGALRRIPAGLPGDPGDALARVTRTARTRQAVRRAGLLTAGTAAVGTALLIGPTLLERGTVNRTTVGGPEDGGTPSPRTGSDRAGAARRAQLEIDMARATFPYAIRLPSCLPHGASPAHASTLVSVASDGMPFHALDVTYVLDGTDEGLHVWQRDVVPPSWTRLPAAGSRSRSGGSPGSAPIWRTAPGTRRPSRHSPDRRWSS
jgi:hypothetical protein